ncbi:hypothetical protein OIO90_000223 [Microbotryomycetes sp. JL221]|nr:hypothetical protein OIO90_000223 [Microbotryomycetes sp. JL221]
MPLHFKGDGPKTKKKRKHRSDGSRHDQDGQQEDDVNGWITVPTSTLALGPLYITMGSNSVTTSSTCVALQPTTGKVYAHVLANSNQGASSSSTTVEQQAAKHALELGLEADELDAVVVDTNDVTGSSTSVESQGPSDVNHVWVCTRVPDSDDKVTLRSGSGKFLAADELGQVTADREARGQQEEFSLEDSQQGHGKCVLRSSYGKLLSIDVVAGGKVELRCDAETETDTERWRVFMQGEYLTKAKKALLDKKGVKEHLRSRDGLTIVNDVGKMENELISKFQARGAGRFVGTSEDKRDLKRAKKEGKLGEAMLDRRVKLKR